MCVCVCVWSRSACASVVVVVVDVARPDERFRFRNARPIIKLFESLERKSICQSSRKRNGRNINTKESMLPMPYTFPTPFVSNIIVKSMIIAAPTVVVVVIVITAEGAHVNNCA